MILLQTNAQTLTVFDLLWKGGPILIPIGILLIIAIYLFIERLFAYFNMSKFDKRTLDGIKHYLVQGDIKQAISLCENQDGALPMILHTGLKTMKNGSNIEETEHSMESMANILFSRINTPLSILGLIAGIAPMLGFVGTVWGIIHIFSNIARTNNIEIGGIADGLYEKMITSLAGLVVGIIAYTAYHLLQYMVEKLALKVETEVFQFLSFLKEPTQQS